MIKPFLVFARGPNAIDSYPTIQNLLHQLHSIILFVTLACFLLKLELFAHVKGTSGGVDK
jgi:hypothetical protein